MKDEYCWLHSPYSKYQSRLPSGIRRKLSKKPKGHRYKKHIIAIDNDAGLEAKSITKSKTALYTTRSRKIGSKIKDHDGLCEYARVSHDHANVDAKTMKVIKYINKGGEIWLTYKKSKNGHLKDFRRRADHDTVVSEVRKLEL